VVGVNIQRVNVHLWAFGIVLAFAPIVVDLLSPATQGVRERRGLAVCLFLVEGDAETESHTKNSRSPDDPSTQQCIQPFCAVLASSVVARPNGSLDRSP
jgi:hypothetical protein